MQMNISKICICIETVTSNLKHKVPGVVHYQSSSISYYSSSSNLSSPPLSWLGLGLGSRSLDGGTVKLV